MKKLAPSPILVADDDPHFLRLIGHLLRGWSYQVETAVDKPELLHRLDEKPPCLLLLDVRFGEHDGLEILRQLLTERPGLQVVMLTAYGSIDDAITALKLGAIDYLTKPVDLDRLRSVVATAAEGGRGGAVLLRETGNSTAKSRPILGQSPAAERLRQLVARIAATDSTALILGESGTGKELVARALHDQSPRRDGPFIAINVAAMPRELVESTLFGHAKGAFTGADRLRRGCCEAADGGTLFLDEIGEMEIGLQAKLLRFLQERSFQRVGQTQLVSVDVRVVAATNRVPLDQVRGGQLREDLYYRLNVLPILVPPLRERREDIPLLAKHFLSRFCDRCDRDLLELTPDGIRELCRHDWPGNIRELENFIERLAVLSPGPTIGPEEIDLELARMSPISQIAHASHSSSDRSPFPSSRSAAAAKGERPASEQDLTEMERLEKVAIVQALEASGGNVRDAAKSIGLGQATVYRKIKKYCIDPR